MTINVTKYRLNPDRVFAGTSGSFGMEKLSFNFDDSWDFDTISVTFHPQRGKPIRVPILSESAEIDIPAEVMAHSGESRFVVSGVILGDGGEVERKAITLEGYVDVAYTADDKGGNTRKVTADVYDQLIDQATEIFNAAREDVERSAAEAAESASDAEGFANEAKEHADAAIQQRRLAEAAVRTANIYKNEAKESAKSAAEASSAAESAANEAQASERAAKTSEENAAGSAVAAADAKEAADAAKRSANTFANSAGNSAMFASNEAERAKDEADRAEQTVKDTLQEAKDSGEFDGPPGDSPYIGENGRWYVGETDTGIAAQGNPGRDGSDGQPGENGQPGEDGFSPAVSVAAITDGHRITITDKTGTKIVDVMDGMDGTDGTSVTVTKVTESTEDGGSNVVTFSDGKTLTVKNGNKGETGEKGDPGDNYVLTETDKKEIAEMNLFRAYYGQTTYAEIEDAWNTGKLCYVSYAGTFWLEGMSATTNNGVSVKKAVFSKAADYATIQILAVSEDNVWSNKDVDLMYRSDKTNVVDENSTDMNVPSAKAVYDAIQAAIPDSGDNSGSSAGMVVYTAVYIDGQATVMDIPEVYPDGANALDLLAAGQVRMVVITPSSGEDESAEKFGVLEFFHVDISSLVVQFVGTITGINGNEAVMLELSLETNETTIMPLVQNSAGSGSSGGGGVVTITDNGDGTYSSSHTPAEIAAMAQTGAVVAFVPMGDDYLFLPLLGWQGTTAMFLYTAPSGAGGGIETMMVMVSNDGVVVDTESFVTPMTGASANSDGTGGTVPAPAAGEQDMVLHGDGTWRAALSEEDKTDLVHRVIEKLPTWEGGTY